MREIISGDIARICIRAQNRRRASRKVIVARYSLDIVEAASACISRRLGIIRSRNRHVAWLRQMRSARSCEEMEIHGVRPIVEATRIRNARHLILLGAWHTIPVSPASAPMPHATSSKVLSNAAFARPQKCKPTNTMSPSRALRCRQVS